MILKILENASKIKYLRRRIKNFFFLFFIDFFKNFSYNEVDNKLIEVRQNINLDDKLYYDAEELRKQVDDRLRKEHDAKIEKEVTQKVTSEVTNAIALKMIKDGLSKEQVINYSQISDEEYETLKKMVFDK